MLRFLFLGIVMLSSLGSYAQKSVNEYKYVIVPKSFEFLGDEDAYQLNSLTKFLFNKYGYIAFIQGDDIPKDLAENGCKALKTSLKKGSGLFVTKLAIQLTDCSGNIVFGSKEGMSREKEYKKAYQEALRAAFKDVQKLNYKYKEIGEVANHDTAKAVSKPKEKKEIISEEVIKEEVKKISTSVESEKPLLYILNTDSFVLEKQGYGYELLKKQNEELISFGKVYKLKRDNSYLIKAGELSGAGHFDNYGNFILERINPATNKLITDTLARQ